VTKIFDIVVVGAGMIGLTLVNLLARNDQQHVLRITLIDAGARPEFKRENEVSLRVSAISAGSSEVLGRIGVWEKIIAERSCAYRNMKVWDAAGSVDGPETLQFDAAEFAVPQLGSIVENVLIQHALLMAAEQTRVSIKFDTAISSIVKAADRYSVLLDSGEQIGADLLVGADGANSFVRQQTGIQLKTWSYPQKAFVTHLRPERSHCDTAWQRFLETGPIGLLPLSDGRVSTVWSTTPELAERALTASDEELRTLLTAATDNVLGQLTPSGPRGAFPLRAQHAEKYVLPGLALIGDAAHSVHPLAGQGANLGFADAAALAMVVEEALAASDNPGDLPVLRRYERSRKSDNQSMLHFVDGLNRLFSNDSVPMARLRGAGMRLFNKSGPIRTQAVQVALGIN
jgi:2-octaprenylphenol hydroxylase